MIYKNIFIIFGFVWNFVTGLTSILEYFKIESKFMTELFSNLTSKELAEYTLLVFAIISLCFATGFAIVLLNQVFNRGSKELNKEQLILKDLIDSTRDPNNIAWSYGKLNYITGVPVTESWENWIKGILSAMNRDDLDYHNFGDVFYFYNLTSGSNINIPTGMKARTEKVGNSFRNGMVLRLMPRET